MMRSVVLSFFLLIVTSLPGAAAENEAVAAELTKMFEAGSADTGSVAVNANFDGVRAYYASRSDKPVWVRDSGPKSKAKVLLGELRISAVHGLDPSFYNAEEIESLMTATDPADLARLDMLLSGAVVEFGNHLRNGRVGPDTPSALNHVKPIKLDPAEYIAGAADAGNFRQYALGILNADKRYIRMLAKLSEFTQIKKSNRWPQFDAAAPPELDKLRTIFLLTGDLSTKNADVKSFEDDAMLRAIENYQRRHSIPVTGRLDEATKNELAVQPADRIRQIRLNIERRRWQNLPLDDNHIYINLADRNVRLVVDGENDGFAELIDNGILSEIPTSYGTIKAVEKEGNNTDLLIQLDLAGPDGNESRLINLQLDTPLNFTPSMQVFITYITTWASREGELFFAPDSFGRDATLNKLLYPE